MARDGGTRIAMLFKERNNPNLMEITTAKVISTSPISLKVGEKIFLGREYNNLIITETVSKSSLTNGDAVLVIPTGNGSLWYAIDKVVI